MRGFANIVIVLLCYPSLLLLTGCSGTGNPSQGTVGAGASDSGLTFKSGVGSEMIDPRFAPEPEGTPDPGHSGASVAPEADGEPGWDEKAFAQLSDNEIEATMNLSKQVYDKVLGEDLMAYYQTESVMVPKKSGYLTSPEGLVRPPRPIVGLSAAYPSHRIDEALIARLEKEALSAEIEWNGTTLRFVDCVVEVQPQGAGSGYDKVTIHPLKVKVRQ